MVRNKFPVVLPGFLKAQYKDDELLTPVSNLHEVIPLEFRCHLPMRVVYWLCWGYKYNVFECELTYPKIFCVIPPCTQLSHNPLEEEISKRIKIDQADTYKAPCTEHREVYQCIPLLPKPIQLRFSLETEVFCNWSAQFDGNHLSN